MTIIFINTEKWKPCVIHREYKTNTKETLLPLQCFYIIVPTQILGNSECNQYQLWDIDNECFIASDEQNRVFVEENKSYQWRIPSFFVEHNNTKKEKIKQIRDDLIKRKTLKKEKKDKEDIDNTKNGEKKLIKRLNGYMLFYHEHAKKHKKGECKEDQENGSVIQQCAQLWKELDDDIKNQYNQRAKEILLKNKITLERNNNNKIITSLTEEENQLKNINDVNNNDTNNDGNIKKKRGRPPFKSKKYVDDSIQNNNNNNGNKKLKIENNGDDNFCISKSSLLSSFNLSS